MELVEDRLEKTRINVINFDVSRLLCVFPDKVKLRHKQGVIDYATNRKFIFVKKEDYLNNCFTEYKDLYAGNIEMPIQFLYGIIPFNSFRKITKGVNLMPPRIWIGAKNTFTHCHKDKSANWTIQLKGKKRWIFFPPEDKENIYINIKYKGSEIEEVSEIDFFKKIDLDRFPLYKKANKTEIICSEGDLLYIPEGWYHAVENIEDSVMINIWQLK